MTELERIWEDQDAFNRQFRQPPRTPKEMEEQVRYMMTCLESECHELLNTFHWRQHRKRTDAENLAHREDEMADIFKCFLSLAQICGFTPDQLYRAYWDKTAVVRQRYREEWLQRIDRPCAVVDIDNVLCDYVAGICQWFVRRGAVSQETLNRIVRTREWVSAESLGLESTAWAALKHEFRTSKAKRDLPVFPDAKPFLEALHRRGMAIVLLTSRPIDRYPNLYTDTLLWLAQHELPFDYIWWAMDKGERLLESGVRQHMVLAVDDDERYVKTFVSHGLPTYWLRRNNEWPDTSLPAARVTSLKDVIVTYDQSVHSKETASWPTTPTPNIDLTPSTPEKSQPR